jgi:hypothetical protein
MHPTMFQFYFGEALSFGCCVRGPHSWASPTFMDIANLKLLLMCFEDMPGLKINYQKSEIIIFGNLAPLKSG